MAASSVNHVSSHRSAARPAGIRRRGELGYVAQWLRALRTPGEDRALPDAARRLAPPDGGEAVSGAR